MIVVDASTVVAALIGANRNGEAARRRLVAATERHAPQLLDIEVASALRRLAAGGHIAEDLAVAAIGQLERLDITRYPHTPLLGRVWELRHQVTAYDAAYVAVAEAVGAPLVTGDARLASVHGLDCSVELID